jgi:hypothetical protein
MLARTFSATRWKPPIGVGICSRCGEAHGRLGDVLHDAGDRGEGDPDWRPKAIWALGWPHSKKGLQRLIAEIPSLPKTKEKLRFDIERVDHDDPGLKNQRVGFLRLHRDGFAQLAFILWCSMLGA